MNILNFLWRNVYILLVIYAIIAGTIFLYNDRQIAEECGKSCGGDATGYSVEHNWCICRYNVNSTETTTERRVIDDIDLQTYHQPVQT